MIESTDLDMVIANVRAAAEACGAMVIDAIVDPDKLPTARVDSAEFPNLLKHLRPRLAYIFMTSFEAREEALELMDIQGSGGAGLKKLIAKWSVRDGQTSRVVLGVMGDGVLHCIAETADWFDDFEVEAEALADTHRGAMAAEFERGQEAERARFEAEEKKRLAPLVKKLTADPRFLAPKISAPKRLALAEMLFPDIDRTTLRKVVAQAVSEHWLAASSTS